MSSTLVRFKLLPRGSLSRAAPGETGCRVMRESALEQLFHEPALFAECIGGLPDALQSRFVSVFLKAF